MNRFTKTHTQISKGFAILMMLYHHLYILPERITCEYFSLLDQIIPNAQITIATFCKLCVCIYVFLSGYGMYYSLKDKNTLVDMYKVVVVRLFKLWTTFLIIYLLFVTGGMLFDAFSTDWKHYVLGLFCFELGYFNNTWWFVNAYIVLLFIAPLFVYFFGKKSLMKKCAVICILPAFYIIVRIYVYLFGAGLIINTYFSHLENRSLIITLLVGVLCARFSIYEKVIAIFDKIENDKRRKIVRILAMFIILVLSVLFRIVSVRNIVDMRFDFLVAPLFVFSSATIIVDLKCKRFFLLFGHHSTTIWLMHAFLCYTYAQKLVFLPYYSELVFIWFILLSLITSYLTNIVLVPLNNLLYSKTHTLSFDGYFAFKKRKI